MLSGAHLTLAPKVVREGARRGAWTSRSSSGGSSPSPTCRSSPTQGVAAVLTPGATADDVVQVVRAAIERSRAAPPPSPGAAEPVTDPLERLTNLVALLLETRRPLTLDEISPRAPGPVRRAGPGPPHRLRTGQAAAQGRGCARWSRRSSAATRPGPPATGSTSRAMPCRTWASPTRRRGPCSSPWPPSTWGRTGAVRRC